LRRDTGGIEMKTNWNKRLPVYMSRVDRLVERIVWTMFGASIVALAAGFLIRVC